MPAVTISGLKYSTTEADFYGLLPLARVYPETTDSVAKTALFITANISEQVRWNQSTGMLTFSLTDNLAAATDHVFVFKLENPAGFVQDAPEQTSHAAITAPNLNITVHANLRMGAPWVDFPVSPSNAATTICACHGIVRRENSAED